MLKTTRPKSESAFVIEFQILIRRVSKNYESKGTVYPTLEFHRHIV